MYDLPYHKEKDEQVIEAFINEHPFAFVTGCNTSNEPVATQVPVLMEVRGGRKLLTGHIMKNTDHHRAFLDNRNVLVVFAGNHTYVSATVYSDPHVPSTWNYMSVHARGIIRFLDDAGLEEVLRKTSLHFENQNHQSPTIFDNLPADFRQKVMKAIVAFEIEVTEIDSVFKLSQDRDVESYLNIIRTLEKQGDDGRVIAAEMERRKQDVFPEDRG